MASQVWGGGSQLRGELILKARAVIPSVYGLPGQLNEDELRKALTWLMQSMKLIHPDIDLKVCTCSENKPWYHPIFLQLIKVQWWGKKDEAKKLGSNKDSNPSIGIPLPLMALVATVVRLFPVSTVFVDDKRDGLQIECVLMGMFTGAALEFVDTTFRDR